METTPATSSTQQTFNSSGPGIRDNQYSRKHRTRKKPDETNTRDNPNKPDHNADDQNRGVRKPQKPPIQRRDGDTKKPISTSRRDNKKLGKAVVEGERKIAETLKTPTAPNFEHSRSNRDDKKGETREGETVELPDTPPRLPTQSSSRRFGKTKFNAGLTSDVSNNGSDHPPPRRRKNNIHIIPNVADAGDLTSNLIRELSTRPYPDCLICFSPIHPQQPTWSCSPLIPMLEAEAAHQSQYCWTTFHLKCIREWAGKNYKEVKAAWEAREEFGKGGEWRCPGCQGRRNQLINGYVCFCGSTRSPSSHLATPHSCGNSCSRPRTSCSHPCPLPCHPGPCPPCKIIMDISCECVRKQTVSVRCGESTQVSCGQSCSKILDCGKHHCQQLCHLGPCQPCELQDILHCWCGKEQKQVLCGEGDIWLDPVGCDDRSTEHMQEPRRGFGCQSVCEKLFDCGNHSCARSCHPPTSDSQPGHCPMSPDRITTCPCGKRSLATSSTQLGDFPARIRCTDEIPTCASTCLRPHSDCEHLCQATCHTSAVCPPCAIDVIRPCRCGSTTRTLKCGELRVLEKDSGLFKVQEILCDRQCMAMRACGRHQCNRICCPLASLAKGKMKAPSSQFDADPNGLHECDLVCPRMLSCGNHRCEERDHRGLCQPCLRSSFEELTCFCGRTVLQPPIPCGTKVHCTYPCSLPPPPCGHPKTPHTCHFPDSICPPCVYLTDKPCACGKKILPNVRCSLNSDKVSCGLVCGKPLSCGGHKCDRPCHAGECGACTSMCGKARKLCLPEIHPCTNLCHAPSSCDEDEPCQTRVELTCECGRIRQAVVCGRSRSNSINLARGEAIKCTTECALKKRNARLADALGIKTGGSGILAEVTYGDDLVAFARANTKFLILVEEALADFVRSNRTKQVLPHTPPEKRNFVYKLAGIYRLDSQMVDQDPYRSVQIIRRLDTRIPNPLLSAYIANKFTKHANNPSLGKLVNLRAGPPTPPFTSSKISDTRAPSPAPPAGTARGWTLAVAPVSTITPKSTTPSRIGTPVPSRPSAELHPTRDEAGNTVAVINDSSSQENVPDNWEDDI
ncbi:hypothetical protein F5879DRAFT_932516 [Lentinula edodes]|nr:hypothetical protein F5879DRAFT_932516 [Lentinula edodes]